MLPVLSFTKEGYEYTPIGVAFGRFVSIDSDEYKRACEARYFLVRAEIGEKPLDDSIASTARKRGGGNFDRAVAIRNALEQDVGVEWALDQLGINRPLKELRERVKVDMVMAAKGKAKVRCKAGDF